MRTLRRFRARELARIAARDLQDGATVAQTTADLSFLADCCLEAACVWANQSLVERYGEMGAGFSIVGLGKLGAGELNFSSDIDILFVYGDQGETTGGSQGSITHLEWAVKAGQIINRLVDRQTEDGRLFRVDLRLRPDGAAGPLAFTPQWAEEYYAKKGQPWERVALLRARHCAGDREVSQRFLDAIDSFVYRREVDTELVAALRDVKQQIADALDAKQRPGFDVKLGRGGIRELEFFVQTLQLLNAGREASLRETRTLALIDRLCAHGLLAAELGASLKDDYCFLRRVEHRLQMIDDQQTHLLPRDPKARAVIASLVGFATVLDLDEKLEGLRERVHLSFLSLFAAEETEEETIYRREIAAQLEGTWPHSGTETLDVIAFWPLEHLRGEPLEAIADGINLINQVTDDDPVATHIIDLGGGRYALRLAGQDRTGLASVSTGVLAGAGLDIEEGRLFTLPAHKSSQHAVGARAVQYLVVRPERRRSLDTIQLDALTNRLRELARRWLHGETEQVRSEINTAWVERMRRHPRQGGIGDIDLEIDNRSDPIATVVGLWAEDAPGFLYGFTQALAMRGINVHQTRIRTVQGRVTDRFHLTDRHGRKITTTSGRHELEVLAVLIKAFSHFLSRAADPVRALVQFDALLDRLDQEGAGTALDALNTEPLLATLATVLGSGAHLFEDFLRLNPSHLLPVLEAISGGTRVSIDRPSRDGTRNERRARVVAWRDAEIFRIDCEHLMQPDSPLATFSENLTHLAQRVIEEAWQLAMDEVADSLGLPIRADGSPIPWCIGGLGKLGSRDLGIASDLEIMVVYGEDGTTTGPRTTSAAEFFERAVQNLRRFMPARRDGIFELDLRLRPFGSHGPLAISAATFASYYQATGGATAYERQALIRLSPFLGDEELADAVSALRDAFTYGSEPFLLAEALALRARQVAELVQPGTVHLKQSPGGLVEVEYTVQYLQIEHGGDNPSVRGPDTLSALDALADNELLSPSEAEVLRGAWDLLRRVIDALRLERGNSRDLNLPAQDSHEATVLARRMGTDVAKLFPQLKSEMSAVAALFRGRFGPLASD